MDPNALPWTEFGALGLMVVSFLMGWVVPGKTHLREVERGDRLEEENKRLRDATEERVLPLVERSIAALEQSNTHLLEDAKSELERMLEDAMRGPRDGR